MGCSNSHDGLGYNSESEPEDEDDIFSKKAVAFRMLDRKDLINGYKMKKNKENFNKNMLKIESMIYNNLISKDLALIRKESDYFTFFNKYENVLKNLEFDKNSFKKSYFNVKCRESLIKDFYFTELNLNQVICEYLQNLISTMDDTQKSKIFGVENSQTFQTTSIFSVYFPHNISEKKEKCFYWPGNLVNKELKDSLVNNLLYSTETFIEVERIKYWNFIFSADDIRNLYRMIKFGMIVKKSKPKAIMITIKVIGDNYNSSVRYSFDAGLLKHFLEEIKELELEHFVLCCSQNVDYKFDFEIIQEICHIISNKSLHSLGIIRIDYDDYSFDSIVKSMLNNTYIRNLLFEPSSINEKFYRLFFNKYIGLGDDFYCEENQTLDAKGIEAHFLVLFGTENINIDEKKKYIKKFKEKGSKLEHVFFEKSILSFNDL